MSTRCLRMFALFLGTLVASFTPEIAGAQSSTSSSDDAGSAVLLVFCCGVPTIMLVLVVIFMNRNRKPYLSSTHTPLDVRKVLQSAIQTYSIGGYQVTSQTDQNVTFTKQTRPNVGFLILLIITGILPGIAYWILANKPFSVNIVAERGSSGTSVNIASSVTGFGAKTTDDNFLASLPKSVGSMTFPPVDESSRL